MSQADTIVTAPPTTLLAAHRPPERGHRVIWFAIGLGLFTIDATLLLMLAWMLLHL